MGLLFYYFSYMYVYIYVEIYFIPILITWCVFPFSIFRLCFNYLFFLHLIFICCIICCVWWCSYRKYKTNEKIGKNYINITVRLWMNIILLRFVFIYLFTFFFIFTIKWVLDSVLMLFYMNIIPDFRFGKTVFRINSLYNNDIQHKTL